MNFTSPLGLLTFGWRDAVEIALVALVLYRVMLLLQGTRAVQMLVGIAVLVLAYAVAWLAKLSMITYLLGLVFTYGAFALLIVFQPELRAALAHLGQSRVTRFFRRLEENEVADAISEAVDRLSRSGIGAIIAVEREMGLGDYAQSGSEMQASVSSDLLQTIFTPYSPLHDGAVIVRGDTIVAAGCILPLTQAPMVDRGLGTRHRAALGLSEETDAVVIVVSEERSTISVATHGRLMRDIKASQLRDVLAGRAPRNTAEQAIVQLQA